MSVWKLPLVGAYYYTTYPLRAWSNAQRRAAGTFPISILFYHRIADDHPNPWTASNRMFACQIEWLSRHFEFISLAEAQRRVRSGRNERPAVAITFDDGYADNCSQALPLLVERRIPCTYFVASQFVLDGQPFPHDVARGQPLQPNTPEQIRYWARQGIEMGAHTRTHADLGPIDELDLLANEVVGSREDLEQITGRPVRYFAFPYGQHKNLNPQVFQLARDWGFAGVCSAYGGFNFPGDDEFHLQRIHVDDDLIRLQNWVTVDPRKLRSIARYEYANHPPVEALTAGAGA